MRWRFWDNQSELFVLFSSQRMMSNKGEKGNSEATIMEKKEERTGERTVATTVVMSDKENDQQESACMGMGSDVKNSVEKNVDNNAVSNTENTTVNNAENNAENNVENNPESDELPEQVASIAGRIPFTSLSQVDADMALARALQEQVCIIHWRVSKICRYKENV